MTGVLMARKGLAKPVGSMTQYDIMRVGEGENKQYLKYNQIVPLADLNDIVFGAWDVYPQNAYESAINCEVLKEKDINPVKEELEKIVPMKAAFDKNYAKRLEGDNVKDCKDRWDMTEQIREDIRNFKKETGVDRVVVLWAASTEVYVPVDEKIHATVESLEAAMKADDREHIAPSMCYAYAALKEGAPFIMGAPNTTVDIPAMWELAEQTKIQSQARTSRQVRHLSNQVSLLSSEHVASVFQAGSQPTFLVTVTDLSLMNPQTSVQKRFPNFLPLNQSLFPKNSLTFMLMAMMRTLSTTTRCVSTTIPRATTIKKAGTTLTSSDGWAIPCR